MDLRQVAQHADDLDRATQFYREVLGCEHLATFDPPGLVFFRLGDTRLLLEKPAPSATIYLAVADARQEIDRLRTAGVRIEQDAVLIHADTDGIFGPAGNEEWMGFIRDSENNLLGLSSQHQPS